MRLSLRATLGHPRTCRGLIHPGSFSRVPLDPVSISVCNMYTHISHRLFIMCVLCIYIICICISNIYIYISISYLYLNISISYIFHRICIYIYMKHSISHITDIPHLGHRSSSILVVPGRPWPRGAKQSVLCRSPGRWTPR